MILKEGAGSSIDPSDTLTESTRENFSVEGSGY